MPFFIHLDLNKKQEYTNRFTCPICLEKTESRTRLSCQHAYCHACLTNWKKVSSTCPLCRGKVEPERKIHSSQTMIQAEETKNFSKFILINQNGKNI